MQPVGRGYHLDRAGFDADLLERAGSLGCRLEPGWHLRSVKVHGQGYRLGFSPSSGPAAGQITRWAEADFVVDASGIGAAFARRLGVARNRFDEVISLCALYRLPEDGDGAPAYTLVQTGELGWWYAARLPHRKAIVSLCTDAETLKQDGLAEPAAWHRAFSASGWLARECRRQFGACLGVPGRLQPKAAPSAILSAVVGERWLAVGDAASSYDSMSSAGITKALIHAGMAGKALADWLRDGSRSLLDAYQTRVFDDFNTYLSLHQAHYRSETGYPRSGFWRRRRM
jgi:flavin-dependent dehydrogenase